MKLWDIIKTVGTGLISATVPGAGLLISAVNEMLPKDKQLPATATGTDIQKVIHSLPPGQQAQLMEKEFDVDITEIKETNSTLRVMLESDTKNPHTTRPYIAKGSFLVIAFTIVVTISMWAYGILKADATLVKAVMDGWPFILAVIGPLVTLLWAYFGVLKNEHRDRLNAASGQNKPSGIAGLISAIMKK